MPWSYGIVYSTILRYYCWICIFSGKQLKSSSDFGTSACWKPKRKLQKHVRDAMKLVHNEVAQKYYGCGIVVPERLEGMNILGK